MLVNSCAVWQSRRFGFSLAGNLANIDARALVLKIRIGSFDWIDFVVAWAFSDEVPALWGRQNFLQSFDVCFDRSRRRFSLQPSGDRP